MDPVIPAPVVPDYGGACISNIVGALRSPGASWLPSGVAGARQIVLLVLDGLGWLQLQERPTLAPTLAAMAGAPITSVAPTTTASALTSITTGLPPAGHGIVGYRMRVGYNDILNVLQWRTAAGDARTDHPPGDIQRCAVFAGTSPPVVTKAEFAETGFTQAHLAGVRLHGWRVPSSVAAHIGLLLGGGEPFVYAYYDGIDKVAHEHGFGPLYDAELRAVDRLVADVIEALPRGAALAVTADHGQVSVCDRVLPIAPEVMARTWLVSGEGRFRWLHARPGDAHLLAKEAREAHSDTAWVVTIDEMEDGGWFGGRLSRAARGRLGDVALVARADVAYVDPSDTGEHRLRCRHGSLTAEEMLVPLLGSFHG